MARRKEAREGVPDAEIEVIDRLSKSLGPGEPAITDFGPWPLCPKTWVFAKWWHKNADVPLEPRVTPHYVYQMHYLPLRRTGFRTWEYRQYQKAMREAKKALPKVRKPPKPRVPALSIPIPDCQSENALAGLLGP